MSLRNTLGGASSWARCSLSYGVIWAKMADFGSTWRDLANAMKPYSLLYETCRRTNWHSYRRKVDIYRLCMRVGARMNRERSGEENQTKEDLHWFGLLRLMATFSSFDVVQPTSLAI
ncbi:uncharacterized protein SPSK_10595 [Sporothrix schenckii 1099-18]|uniref:Uncharacterized protein n=1 Tax=Sporothrix schenckii 1099-18 TaxID=1397361 RepID=A0A0F2M3U0_SPOSC|nr:uncharacterized protein SPSK_10595 [Sporothrix schenckii 1099-18]KJR82836.1 hypothetical protein SPSK_10595 [Sporothrix schenckii 1099-18]